MGDKSAIDTIKERLQLLVAAAKAKLSPMVDGAKTKPKIFAAEAKAKLTPVVDGAKTKPKILAAEAKAKLSPMVERAKTKKTVLTADAKTKLTTIKGQAEGVHEHPKLKSFIAKLKQKDPLTVGGTFVVVAICVWFAFTALSDTKPSDKLLFETVTSDGGNGLVYDTKILARDGFEDGANKYVVEVEYEITWKMGQKQALEVMMELAYKEMKAQGMPDYQIKMALMFGGLSVGLLPLVGEKPFKAGDRKKMTDVFTFVKAESGWRVVEDR